MRYVRQGLKEFLLLCVVGIIVAWVIVALLQLDYVENIDRYVSDILMRHAAEQMRYAAEQEVGDKEPGFFFINVGQDTCEGWAKRSGTSCTLGWATPRDRLANIVCRITEYIKKGAAPRLIVIDIELAPQPHRETSDAKGSDNQASQSPNSCSTTSSDPQVQDRNLRQTVFDLLKADPNLALITIRPMDINPEGKPPVTGFRSILDPDRPENLWFASAVIQADTDGVVRQVHGWDEQIYNPTNSLQTIAGIGLLGAALLDNKNVNRNDLACIFDGSKPRPANCPASIKIGGRPYPRDGDWEKNTYRILFSLPVDERGQPQVSDLIDTREAKTFEIENGEDYSKVLTNRVIVIGGSYLASGDLRVTPLGRMPGAMVHANAIRAISKGWVVEEKNFRDTAFWQVKLRLIALAAIFGAVFHVWSRRATWGLPISLALFVVAAVVTFRVAAAGWPWRESFEIAVSIAFGVCIGASASRLRVPKFVASVAVMVVGLTLVAVLGMASEWSWESLVAGIIIGAVGLAVCIYFLGLPIVVALLGLAVAAVAIFGAVPELPLAWLVAVMCTGALGLAIFIGALGPEILVSLIGAAVTAMVVLGVGSSLAFEKLLAGTVIGTFVPALAVAFEGLCGALHEIRELAPRDLDDP